MASTGYVPACVDGSAGPKTHATVEPSSTIYHWDKIQIIRQSALTSNLLSPGCVLNLLQSKMMGAGGSLIRSVRGKRVVAIATRRVAGK